MTQQNTPFASLNDINAIVLVANSSGSIIFANKAIKKILGYTPEEVLGDAWWKLTSVTENTELRKEQIASMAIGETHLKDKHLFESLLLAKDGRKVWTQWTNTRTADGLLVGTAQDITEKKKLQEELLQKNHENQLLLKEIHHRVKNNLQVISSFLNLQFNGINDKLVQDALSKSKDRINSMALIHNRLFQSENLSSINFGEYINQLATSIKNSYSHINPKVNCLVHSTKIFLNVDLSINLGLIITELLTNAYKHAFSERSEGQIQIEVAQSGDQFKLIISDNGIGLNNKKKNVQSLGLEIVEALIDQINGTIEITSNEGLKYVISFKEKTHSSRYTSMSPKATITEQH
ncbi:MAG: PAS domain S-box protein [Crocinitomicaceae bacterium]|nr:PAS domain S-box protein [Crocinitomicaceae bacterium]